MNILVIGNGFDLAHKLPTKYTDFLEFINVIKQIVGVKSSADIQYISWGNIHPEIKMLIERNMGNAEENLPLQDEEWKKLLDDNIWVDYFLKNTMYLKYNWIDFEKEIGKVIHSLEVDMFEAKKEYELDDNMDELSNVYLKRLYSKYSRTTRSASALTNTYYGTVTFRQIRDKVLDDLNRLIRALELYLSDYVEVIKIQKLSPDIKKLINNNEDEVINKILSFNYTSTYNRAYGCEKFILDEDIDYIHGKAKGINTIESNNMVLGIQESLSEEKKNENVEFIAFKKFYQRIYKETGCKYKEWVEKIIEDENKPWIINGKDCSKDYIHNVYIFGHSLDVTDGDILRDFIRHNNVRTTIFYRNKEQHGQQIANLVKVIGQDELIRRTGGKTKTIEFRLQQEMIEVK